MATWITSDLHFGHKNIMKFCPVTRQRYKTVEDMDNEMITEWNSTVKPTDTVYILGDVSFAGVNRTVEILDHLNGSKILVIGNHDKKLMQHEAFRECFESTQHYLEINYAGTMVIMSHFPFAEWDQMHRGAVHFYGHLHQNTVDGNKYRARNVGMDCTGQILILLEDAIADALKGEIKQHHGD